MSDPTTLLALAERCEQAARPDKELDQDITKLLVPRNAEPVYRSRYGWSFIVSGSGKGFEWLQNQPYTASLDAAVTLVPVELPRNLRPGKWWWMLETWPDECRASVHYENGDPAILEESAKAATPALALCAAALRARAANQ
jgi:hypothetical protein